MNNEKWPVVQYEFDATIDLFTAFEQAGIEHLEVSNERTIVIYSRTIFDLEVPDEDLANAQLITVEIFDVSSDHSSTDDFDPVSLTEHLIDELAATMNVKWERR